MKLNYSKIVWFFHEIFTFLNIIRIAWNLYALTKIPKYLSLYDNKRIVIINCFFVWQKCHAHISSSTKHQQACIHNSQVTDTVKCRKWRNASYFRFGTSATPGRIRSFLIWPDANKLQAVSRPLTSDPGVTSGKGYSIRLQNWFEPDFWGLFSVLDKIRELLSKTWA